MLHTIVVGSEVPLRPHLATQSLDSGPQCYMDWPGFEPGASPLPAERYTRFNYQPMRRNC